MESISLQPLISVSSNCFFCSSDSAMSEPLFEPGTLTMNTLHVLLNARTKLFKSGCKRKKIESSQLSFIPSLCQACSEVLKRIGKIIEEIKKLNCSLEGLRQEVCDKLRKTLASDVHNQIGTRSNLTTGMQKDLFSRLPKPNDVKYLAIVKSAETKEGFDDCENKTFEEDVESAEKDVGEMYPIPVEEAVCIPQPCHDNDGNQSSEEVKSNNCHESDSENDEHDASDVDWKLPVVPHRIDTEPVYTKVLRKRTIASPRPLTHPLHQSQEKESKTVSIPFRLRTIEGEILKGSYNAPEEEAQGLLNSHSSVARVVNCDDDDDKDADESITIEEKNIMQKEMMVRCNFNGNKCSKSFNNVTSWRQHTKKAHGPNDSSKLKCPFAPCVKRCRNTTELKEHVRDVHTKEQPFSCDHCSQQFSIALKREIHVERCHPEVPPLKCHFCDQAFFRCHRLNAHIKSHTGEKSYLCELCGKSFSQPAYLRYHQTTHDVLKMDPFKCDMCLKTFATPTNLKLHKRTMHDGSHAYNCNVCGMGISHQSKLLVHMRTHSGERPFACDICGKPFQRKSTLNVHKRQHTGEKAFPCPTCNKSFLTSSKLQRHSLSHGSGSFFCPKCGKACKRSDHLKVHERSCSGGQTNVPIST